jgi:hypothetical protein
MGCPIANAEVAWETTGGLQSPIVAASMQMSAGCELLISWFDSVSCPGCVHSAAAKKEACCNAGRAPGQCNTITQTLSIPVVPSLRPPGASLIQGRQSCNHMAETCVQAPGLWWQTFLYMQSLTRFLFCSVHIARLSEVSLCAATHFLAIIKASHYHCLRRAPSTAC